MIPPQIATFRSWNEFRGDLKSESIRRTVSRGQKTATLRSLVGELFPVLGKPKPSLAVNGTSRLRSQNSALLRFFAEPMAFISIICTLATYSNMPPRADRSAASSSNPFQCCECGKYCVGPYLAQQLASSLSPLSTNCSGWTQKKTFKARRQASLATTTKLPSSRRRARVDGLDIEIFDRAPGSRAASDASPSSN